MEDKPSESGVRSCAWCAEPARETDRRCAACGANLAQRESIGELVIPGVTHVDPGLQQYAADPLRIPGSSPSHSVAGSAIGAAVMGGGPMGLVALAGLGAVAAAEYLTAGRGPGSSQADLARLGQPSEAVLKMLEQLERQESSQAVEASEALEPDPAPQPEPPEEA